MTTSAVSSRSRLTQVEEELLARWPETRMDPTLDRVAMLLELLDQPQRGYRSIHLTGTNGKTSTARIVEALLAASGTRTGRLTSPHLASIRAALRSEDDPPSRLSRPVSPSFSTPSSFGGSL